jgi:hypothetical protein
VWTAGKRLLARWYEIHLAIARPIAPILSSFVSNARAKIRDTKAIRWAVIALVGIVSGAWFGSRPNPQAIQRQQNCLSWGIKDPRVLSSCRESDELETAAIAALRRKSVEREISEFNRDLITLDNKKTITRRTDYLGWTLEKVAKSVNGARGLGMTLDANFPSKGLAIKVVGLVITHQYDPHYYTLDADSPPATSRNGDEATRWSVNLDIEALSPIERQFIIENCFERSVTPCRATVLGHLGEIVERSEGTIKYVGVVADQMDIQPLTWNTAFPSGIPSVRSLSPIAND